MDRWIYELKQIGFLFFGRGNAGEMWGLVAFSVIVSFFLFKKLSSGFAGRGEKTYLTLIPGVFLMALSAAAVRIYLGGDVRFQIAAVAICFFAVVTPITMRVEKTSYIFAIVPWLLTAAALAAILFFQPVLRDMMDRGIEKGSLLKYNRDQVKFWDK